jgi:nitrite reductase/ring-hydroxylating ferredoxin subunit
MQEMKTDARTAVLDEQPGRVRPGAERREPKIPARGLRFSQGDPQRSASPPSVLRHASRRLFLKAGITSLGAFALWIMDRVARNTESIPENSETTLTVPWSAAQGIHFYDRTIVANGADGVAVFSSKCPHLGCRINRTEGSELVCPCHGSRFDLQGNVVQGPATRSLSSLPYALDRAKAVLRVTLGSGRT